MRIEVTPECVHPDGFRDHGEPIYGQHAVINHTGVWLNGVHVIARDRRAKKNRDEGHPWLVQNGDDSSSFEPRTGFSVRVDPNDK